MGISTWCGLNVSFRSSMLKLSYQGDVAKCWGLEKTIGLQDRILNTWN